MKRFILFSLICLAIVWHAQAIDRWQIQKDGSICWIPAENLPHEDHLEMSGQMLSVVLRYGVDADKSFHLNRSLVFPMLRMKPNKTGSNLKQRFDVDIPAMITVDDQTLLNEKVERVMFDGILRVESDYGYIHRQNEHCPPSSHPQEQPPANLLYTRRFHSLPPTGSCPCGQQMGNIPPMPTKPQSPHILLSFVS